MAKYEKELIELKESPLFALTLGGKELAHSNFWEWLMNIEVNNEHPFVSVFVNDYDKTCTFDSVKREEENRDLTVRYTKDGKKKAVIIENKIKSIPKIDQLEDYENNFKKKKKENHKFEEGILTGLIETLDLSKLKSWKYLEYDKIAGDIKAINNKKCKGLQWYEYIQKYANDIDLIHEIISGYVKDKSGSYITEAPPEIEELRLGDIYLKLLGNIYAKDVIENNINRKKKELTSKWGMPEVQCDFNHKKPTITCIYKKKLSDNKMWKIGIQLEGQQFRIYAGVTDSNSKYLDKEKIRSHLVNNKWFEEKVNGKLRGKNTGMTKECCKYEGAEKIEKGKNKEKYTHVYQWWKIENKGKLIDEIIEELKEAKKLIDNGFSFE